MESELLAEPLSEDDAEAANEMYETNRQVGCLVDEPGPDSRLVMGVVSGGREMVEGAGGKNEMTKVKNWLSTTASNLLCITSSLGLHKTHQDNRP